MNRLGLVLLMILLVFAPVYAETAGYQFGYVDGAQLIALHPLMQQFDPGSRRFIDTVSQPRPSENPTEYIQRLQQKLDKQKALLTQLDANYADKITGKGMAARKAWWAFWKRRESLRIYQNLLQEAITQAAVHGNFYLNMPSDWSLMPVAMAISASIGDACEYLRSSNNLSVVLDTSIFMQHQSKGPVMEFIPNRHWQIWRGEALSLEELQEIGSSLKASIIRAAPELAHKPFVAGAMNLNPLAVSLLSDITLPSADLPDDQETTGE